MGIPSNAPRRGRKRVALVLKELGASGASRAAVEQAECLDPAEWEVEIACLERWQSSRGRTRPKTHIPVRHPGPLGLAAWLSAFAPDLVHAHLAHATLACRLALPFVGNPALVATCHELSDWREQRYWPLSLLLRASLRHCGAVLAASEAVRAAIADDAALASRTRVLRNGTDLSAFTAVRGMHASAREVLGYRPGTFVVGTVARLDPSKGLDLLLDAASLALPRVPGLELLIVGDGEERGRLVARMEALGLHARVRFVGDQVNVRPYLAAFDLFVAPSRSGGSGRALVEALAAGVPVAGSPVGGIPETLAGGAAGWLVPATVEAWTEALVRASRSPGELERLCAAGLTRAGEYSIERTRGQLTECYRSVIGGAGGGARDSVARESAA